MKLKKTRCAICGTFDNSTVLHLENFPNTGISSAEYAPRRDRDYAHYQIVRCNTCNLARSDPMEDSEIIDDGTIIDLTLGYTGQEYITSVSIYISTDGINYNFLFTSDSVSLAPNQTFSIDLSGYPELPLQSLDENVFFKASIVDEEGYSSANIAGYSDVSDYPIIISDERRKQLQNNFPRRFNKNLLNSQLTRAEWGQQWARHF